MRMPTLYFLGLPGNYGGATTKLTHLLGLLRRRWECVIVHETDEHVDGDMLKSLALAGIRCATLAELPGRLEGSWAVALCNSAVFASGMAGSLKERGAKIAWSNEMTWVQKGERGALVAGLIDKILYTSPVQRRALEPLYWGLLNSHSTWIEGDTAAEAGVIPSTLTGEPVPWVMTGNYILPEAFPFFDRESPERRFPDEFVIGRLSRDDPDKFPVDFPESYEGLGLEGRVKFRVMAWSEALRVKWSGHHFNCRWDLLPVLHEDQTEFLQSLDLFVYETSPGLCESWGRATVEAMLTGAIPLVEASTRHHLHRLVVDGETGFLCPDRAAFGETARRLQRDPGLRRRLSRQAREHAAGTLCRAEEHLRLWSLVFEG